MNQFDLTSLILPMVLGGFAGNNQLSVEGSTKAVTMPSLLWPDESLPSLPG